MDKIKLVHISFLKKDLDCISLDEQAFLLQVGGLIHEIISLQKFIIMSSHGIDNHIQRMAENAQGMYFYKMLAGTLYEGWQLLTKRHRKYRIIIAKYKPQLQQKAKESFKKLEDYFRNKNNACERIRNQFSHHHDYREILKMIKNWPGEDKLELYISDVHANCRYTASDIVTNLAMLGTTDLEELRPRLDELLRQISEIAKASMEFISEYLSLIVQQIIEKKGIKGEEIEINDAPLLNEVRIPFFVVADKDKNHFPRLLGNR